MGERLISSPKKGEVWKEGKVGGKQSPNHPHHHLPSRREVGGEEGELGASGEVRINGRIYAGQRYEAGEPLPYTRRDGAETHLRLWPSHRARCGTAFTITLPATATKFQPNRRCSIHVRPGVRPRKVVSL